jgi:hypothetical protein
MEGQFHKKLSLIKDDPGNVIGVAVSGPITWDGEKSATFHATISQGGLTVGGMAADVPNTSKVWAFVAPMPEGVGPLEEGPAIADAVAIARNTDDTIQFVHWTSPPDPAEITLV